jgi:hypothetical protein
MPEQPPNPGYGYPQQPYGYAPPPPKKSPVGKILGFGCLGAVAATILLVIIGVAVSGGDDNGGGTTASDSSDSDANGPAEEEKEPRGFKWAAKGADTSTAGWDDVEITSCEAGEFGYPKAEVKITNRSSDTSNYSINLEFVDPSGKRLSEGIAATNNLASGQSTTQEASGFEEVSGEFKCKFTEITRYAS